MMELLSWLTIQFSTIISITIIIVVNILEDNKSRASGRIQAG